MIHFVEQQRFFLRFFVMAFCEVFEFTCAVRGFHAYRKFWIPEKGQLLNCFHESGNVFDLLAIKVCERNNKKLVENLPREISRVTKFIIEWGATVDLQLTSDSPVQLVQGGLEIKCEVTIKVPNATPRQVTEQFRALAKELYVEPKEEKIIGWFVVVSDNKNMDEDLSIHQRSTRPGKQPSKPSGSTIKSRDIRTFFNH